MRVWLVGLALWFVAWAANATVADPKSICTPPLHCTQYSLKPIAQNAAECNASVAVLKKMTGLADVQCSFYLDIGTRTPEGCTALSAALGPLTGFAYQCFTFNDYSTLLPYMCRLQSGSSIGITKLCGAAAGGI